MKTDYETTEAKDRICEKCIYYGWYNDSIIGVCKRYPPQPIKRSKQTFFNIKVYEVIKYPTVYFDNRACGEFKRKDENN